MCWEAKTEAGFYTLLFVCLVIGITMVVGGVYMLSLPTLFILGIILIIIGSIILTVDLCYAFPCVILHASLQINKFEF
jgi:hypothetical protein